MSNYDRRDRQDETAMWDAGEVRRQESAQQQRRAKQDREVLSHGMFHSCYPLQDTGRKRTNFAAPRLNALLRTIIPRLV